MSKRFEARIKTKAKKEEEYPLPVLQSAGQEFVKYEWRLILEGSEEEIKAHEHLEVRARKEIVVEAAPSTPAPSAPDGDNGGADQGDADQGGGVSEKAQEFADKYGLDLSKVEGTGADSGIIMADVQKALVQRAKELKTTKAVFMVAVESGVDIETIKGTGADGTITSKDVQNAVKALEDQGGGQGEG